MNYRALLLFIGIATATNPACAAPADTAALAYAPAPAARRGYDFGTEEGMPRKILKINALAAVGKNLSLQYEHGLGPKTSLALGLRAMPRATLPLHSLIGDVLLGSAGDKDAAATNDFLQRGHVGGWAVTPEFRYYLGAGCQHGFYLAPYLRYARLNLGWNYTFNDEGTLRPTVGHMQINIAGGGLMVGAQWHFGKIALDWWIMGASYNAVQAERSMWQKGYQRTKPRGQLYRNAFFLFHVAFIQGNAQSPV